MHWGKRTLGSLVLFPHLKTALAEATRPCQLHAYLGKKQRGWSKPGCISYFDLPYLPHLWQVIPNSSWIHHDEGHGLNYTAVPYATTGLQTWVCSIFHQHKTYNHVRNISIIMMKKEGGGIQILKCIQTQLEFGPRDGLALTYPWGTFAPSI